MVNTHSMFGLVEEDCPLWAVRMPTRLVKPMAASAVAQSCL